MTLRGASCHAVLGHVSHRVSRCAVPCVPCLLPCAMSPCCALCPVCHVVSRVPCCALCAASLAVPMLCHVPCPMLFPCHVHCAPVSPRCPPAVSRVPAAPGVAAGAVPPPLHRGIFPVPCRAGGGAAAAAAAQVGTHLWVTPGGCVTPGDTWGAVSPLGPCHTRGTVTLGTLPSLGAAAPRGAVTHPMSPVSVSPMGCPPCPCHPWRCPCPRRRLRCTRNLIHANLFVSFALRAGAILTRDALLPHGHGHGHPLQLLGMQVGTRGRGHPRGHPWGHLRERVTPTGRLGGTHGDTHGSRGHPWGSWGG